jgi:outer membrane protein OmpA-like peptidoglycan-associated protein
LLTILKNNMKACSIIFLAITICFISATTYSQEPTVKTIYFESNSSMIDGKSKQLLDEIGRKCISDTMTNLKIFAYADTSGTIKHNRILSEKRALAVFNYLVKTFHLDSSKIYSTWLGEETDGAYDLHFPAAHLQQRCVDVVVSFKKH